VDRLRVAALTGATETQLAEVARLFDQYRQHYGEPAAPAQALAWLTRHTRSQQLAIFTAHRGPDLVGLATTVTVPASLQLGCFWQLRDLYVTPSARRCGAGRALLQTVRQAAAAAGATRLSVQTEPANTAALQLYRTSGFTPVRGIEALILPLPQDGT
jgi:GNAT superfamily N-acetyltransferase